MHETYFSGYDQFCTNKKSAAAAADFFTKLVLTYYEFKVYLRGKRGIKMLKFKLKVELAKNSMTQKQLAEITGIRPPTISAICLGTVKHIPVSALERICQTLHCQPGDIVEYIGQS